MLERFFFFLAKQPKCLCEHQTKYRIRPQFQAIFVYANISGFLRHISVASPAETWLSSKSLRNRTGIQEEDSNSRRYVPVENNNEERQ